jgi:hypothetical protein
LLLDNRQVEALAADADLRPCGMCKILGRGEEPKKVAPCGLCGELLCSDCSRDYGWRVVAAFKKVFGA